MRRPVWTILAGILIAVTDAGTAQNGIVRYPASSQLTRDGTAVMLEDYASAPQSSPKFGGAAPPRNDFEGLPYQLARVNVLVSEPANAPRSASRFFVIDQNGFLYTLDKKTRQFTPYIDFGKGFPNFANASPNGGFGTGVSSIAFDPAYTRNGKFYTAHTEKPNMSRAGASSNVRLPGLDSTGFTTTAAINPPAGGVGFESVLIEWTDSNIRNDTFEGSAREVLRAGFSFVFHPMGDLLFNPLARAADADYGNLYIAMGDGTAGERAGVTHTIPQRLDALQGKILRITPDVRLRPRDKMSANGQYRIPSTGSNSNPFVSISNARAEIYAYGFRNPHRMTWDPGSNNLIANDIGAGSWEEVNIIRNGGNYGWAEREGPEQVFVGGPNNGRTGSRISPPVPFPYPDTVVVEGLEKPVRPIYPVAAFSHRDGASIGSGFVYRGKLMRQLSGKYVFTDIVTGRLFYSDLKEMQAGGGLPHRLAEIHELQVVYKSPDETSVQRPANRRIFDIIAEEYARKGGVPLPGVVLPGLSGLTNAGTSDPYGIAYGGGRADVRSSMDADGELYLLSKTDGKIRKLTAVVTTRHGSRE